jgi:hypothetical protein
VQSVEIGAARRRACEELFEQISQLNRRARRDSVRWVLIDAETRLQNNAASNDLDLIDTEIKRARGVVAVATKLLDQGGPDAEWPK